MRTNVPIYLVKVLVYIYNDKEFLREKVVNDIMIKGFTKKHILALRNEDLKKRTSQKLSLKRGTQFKIIDINLTRQHGFGVYDF